MKKAWPTQTELPSAACSLWLRLNVSLELEGAAPHRASVHKTQGGGEGPAGKQEEKCTTGSAWGKLGPLYSSI